MTALDPRIDVIRERFGLSRDDFWELPQKKGTWIAKHAALEVAAVKANIEFDNPVTIEAGTEAGIAVISVSGVMPGIDGAAARREWSIGEASPKNNKNAYPWAMAEKRAKDRVILKLIGIHGLVYSEDEADDFSAPRGGTIPTGAGPVRDGSPKAQTRDVFSNLMEDLRAAGNQGRASLRQYWESVAFNEAFDTLKKDWQEQLVLEKDAFLASYPKPTGRVDPNASLDRQFAETVGQP